MRRGIPLLLSLLLVTAGAALRPARAQDVVWKNDGGKLRGKIVREGRDGVTIETPGGTYTVPPGEIARIERSADVFKELEQRRARVKAGDVHGLLDLGKWCQNQELYPQAIDAFNEVLQLEPDDQDARFELGYRRNDGKWVTESEYYEAKGYKRWVDRWVAADEYDKLQQGLVLKDGRWVADEGKDAPAASAPATSAPTASARRDPPRGGGAGTTPATPGSEGGAARPRGPQGFPWGAGGQAPLGGQVGGKPLSAEERAAQLERQKTAGSWAGAYSTKYYDVFSNGSMDEAQRFGKTMDLVCEEFKTIFKFEGELTRPFPINLYANQQEFMSRTNHGPGVGGFYDGSKIVAYHEPSSNGGHGTQSTLFHEGTHQFQGLVMGQNMWRAKIWLIEGLAVFFEATDVQGKKVNTGAIPRDRLGSVKRAIQSGTYIRLHDLVRMEQAQFGALHYAHAWSLIYFFINGAGGGKKRFVEYWERAKAGEDGVKLFEEIFDKPIDEIETAWKAYVLALG